MSELPVPSDPVNLAFAETLMAEEVGYVEAARAANTLRGYRSDWQVSSWCRHHDDREPMPAAAATLTGYLTGLAQAGAKVGTMSRRLPVIKFVHQLQDQPEPTRTPGSSPSGRGSAGPTAHCPTRRRR